MNFLKNIKRRYLFIFIYDLLIFPNMIQNISEENEPALTKNK